VARELAECHGSAALNPYQAALYLKLTVLHESRSVAPRQHSLTHMLRAGVPLAMAIRMREMGVREERALRAAALAAVKRLAAEEEGRAVREAGEARAAAGAAEAAAAQAAAAAAAEAAARAHAAAVAGAAAERAGAVAALEGALAGERARVAALQGAREEERAGAAAAAGAAGVGLGGDGLRPFLASTASSFSRKASRGGGELGFLAGVPYSASRMPGR
jgi:hypothetical protein